MRGGRGSMQPNSRPNPMQGAPNHQQQGMMQPNMPVKRGPPMGPPGPKRGKSRVITIIYKLNFHRKFLLSKRSI